MLADLSGKIGMILLINTSAGTTEKIQNDAVTVEKLASNSVGTASFTWNRHGSWPQSVSIRRAVKLGQECSCLRCVPPTPPYRCPLVLASV